MNRYKLDQPKIKRLWTTPEINSIWVINEAGYKALVDEVVSSKKVRDFHFSVQIKSDLKVTDGGQKYYIVAVANPAENPYALSEESLRMLYEPI